MSDGIEDFHRPARSPDDRVLGGLVTRGEVHAAFRAAGLLREDAPPPDPGARTAAEVKRARRNARRAALTAPAEGG